MKGKGGIKQADDTIELMEDARWLAAQCWCDKETEKKVMDPVLAEAIAKRIAAWMGAAAQNQRNADYYRGLVVRCGEAIGEPAYVRDDGTISDDVLCAKVPEIIEFDYKLGGNMRRYNTHGFEGCGGSD